MSEEYDLIVIGSGAASVAAKTCADAGWAVAVVDSRPFGGTCALRGCIPKKVYYAGAQAMDWVYRMSGKGIDSGSVQVNWSDLQEFKRSFTKPVPEQTEEWLRNAGITPISGRAHFKDEKTIEVNGKEYSARKYLIAAGSRPRPLDIPGSEHLVTSDEFLELEELPERIVCAGGGYISMEFAHIAARAGVQVTILHRNERPLPFFEPEILDLLLQTSGEVGIDIHLNTEVISVLQNENQFIVKGDRDGKIEEYPADLVIHGAGRVPDIADMRLENAGVEFDQKGIIVNRYLQSQSNHDVYAAGDAAESGPPLTPVATMEGHIAGKNLIQGNQAIPDYTVIPTVVFTLPPVASVGLKEATAEELQLDYTVRQGDTSDWVTSRRENERHSGFKILVEEGTDHILGAHLFGPEAHEVINIFALAMEHNITAASLKEMVYTYPTSSSDIPAYL